LNYTENGYLHVGQTNDELMTVANKTLEYFDVAYQHTVDITEIGGNGEPGIYLQAVIGASDVQTNFKGMTVFERPFDELMTELVVVDIKESMPHGMRWEKTGKGVKTTREQVLSCLLGDAQAG
jgi:hypothetical protein